MSGPARCEACAELVEDDQELWEVHGDCMRQGIAAAHARGVAEERARADTTTQYARAVATIWRDAAMLRVASGDSLWALVSHPLALVLGALDGETEPSELGVSASALAAAMAPSSPQDDRGGPEGSAGV